MALQHRILHRLLVAKNYVAAPEDWADEDNSIRVVTSKITELKGHFAYHFGIASSIVDSMIANPGAIPDAVLVEYGIDNEDLNELALCIDNLDDYTAEEPEDGEVEDTADKLEVEIDLNALLQDA